MKNSSRFYRQKTFNDTFSHCWIKNKRSTSIDIKMALEIQLWQDKVT